MAVMFMFTVFRIWRADFLKQILLERRLKKERGRHVHVLMDGHVIIYLMQ